MGLTASYIFIGIVGPTMFTNLLAMLSMYDVTGMASGEREREGRAKTDEDRKNI